MQTWLDHRTALLGTKCNKLLVMDLQTKQVVHLPQPIVPQQYPRPEQVENRYGRCARGPPPPKLRVLQRPGHQWLESWILGTHRQTFRS